MNLAKKINLHYTTIQGSFGIGFGALMSFGVLNQEQLEGIIAMLNE